MNKDIFKKGTYWYKSRVVAQFSEIYSEEDHYKVVQDLGGYKEYAKLTEEERIRHENEREKVLCSAEIREACVFCDHDVNAGIFDNSYINPLVLFVNDGKLIVEAEVSDEYGENETPYVHAYDFGFDTAIPVSSLKNEVKKKFGVTPTTMHYAGFVELKHAIEIEGFYEKDVYASGFLHEDGDIYDDDEEPEEYGDDCVSVICRDVIVCSDWKGDFQFPEGEDGEKYVPCVIGLNQLDEYGLDSLIEIFGNLHNYGAWAVILYRAGLLDKIQI